MQIHEICKPRALALLDKRTICIYNFSNSDMQAILKFSSVPSFQDVLISKSDQHLEIMITVKKTFCLHEKINRLNILSHILEQLTNNKSIQTENILQEYPTYKILTIKYTLNAVNK